MKTVLIVITTLVVAVFGFWAWGHYAGARELKGDDGTSVRIEPAQQGDLVEIVSAPGTMQPLLKVQISAKVSARIVSLPFPEGAAVTRGNPDAKPPIPASVLVQLDSKDLEATLRSASARYAAQKSQIEVSSLMLGVQEQTIKGIQVQLTDAKRDLDRQVKLFENKDVSQATVDAAQVKLDNLQTQLEGAVKNLASEKANVEMLTHTLDAAEADVARAKEDLSNTVILAPIDGVVTKLNAKVGEVAVTGILNSPGTVIMEVGDLSSMLMVAKVDDVSVTSLKPGQKAKVRVPAYRDRVFEGIVDTIALTNTEDTDGSKYFETKIKLQTGGERIYSGLVADADIETETHAHSIMVPSQAVLGRPADELPEAIRQVPEVDRSKTLATVVFRVVDGKAVATPVTVGASDATRTQIISGLKPGDLIVTGPYKELESIKHDQKVKDNRAVPATRSSMSGQS